MQEELKSALSARERVAHNREAIRLLRALAAQPGPQPSEPERGGPRPSRPRQPHPESDTFRGLNASSAVLPRLRVPEPGPPSKKRDRTEDAKPEFVPPKQRRILEHLGIRFDGNPPPLLFNADDLRVAKTALLAQHGWKQGHPRSRLPSVRAYRDSELERPQPSAMPPDHAIRQVSLAYLDSAHAREVSRPNRALMVDYLRALDDRITGVVGQRLPASPAQDAQNLNVAVVNEFNRRTGALNDRAVKPAYETALHILNPAFLTKLGLTPAQFNRYNHIGRLVGRLRHLLTADPDDDETLRHQPDSVLPDPD